MGAHILRLRTWRVYVNLQAANQLVKTLRKKLVYLSIFNKDLVELLQLRTEGVRGGVDVIDLAIVSFGLQKFA